MTDVKISQLPTVTTIDAATDVLPLVSLDGGSTLTTYQATAQQTVDAALAAPGPIGSGTANTGAFTTLSASSTVSGTGFNNLLASPPAIGGTAPAAGSFTNVSSSGTVSGAGFSNYLASPPAIGGTAAAAGSFTNLSASGTVSGSGFSSYLASPPAIGGTAAAAGSFTNLSASGTVSGTGFSSYLASPPAIGGTAAAAGSFTTLSASSTVSGTGLSNYLASPPAIGGTAAAAGSFTTLNASSNVTLSGGTANGVVYLDGSKNAASGTALTFDGTNFGINAATPGAPLHVAGTLNSTPTGSGVLAGLNANYGQIKLYGSTGGILDFGVSGADGKGRILYNNASNYMAFGTTNGVEQMRLDTSGNLGLGVTPSAWGGADGNLQLKGAVSTGGYTVATLPTGIPTGSRAYVTDALTPVVLTAVAGGGAVVVPVFYNGSAWIVG